MDNGYGIAFDGKGDTDTARNIIILVLLIVHHFMLIIKNNFLVLGERDTLGINGSFGAAKTKFNLNFIKANKFS